MVEHLKVTQPHLVLVTGLPGTGKSTIAEVAAELMDAPVLAHDWAMSGLRPFPDVQRALDLMKPPGHGPVGWSILRALARAALRRNSSVILDGVAREAEVELCRVLAEDEATKLVVILTECADLELHRSRIEDRTRAIPNWYELSWDDVQRSRMSWSPPEHVDLSVQSTHSWSTNRELVMKLLVEG